MRRVADRPQPKAPSWLAWDGTARTGTAGPTRPAEAPASLAPDLPSTTTHPIGTRPTLHESERLRYVCTLGLSVPGAWRASMTRFRREIARLHAATPENKRLAKSVIVTSRTAVDCMVMMSPGPSARQPPPAPQQQVLPELPARSALWKFRRMQQHRASRGRLRQRQCLRFPALGKPGYTHAFRTEAVHAWILTKSCWGRVPAGKPRKSGPWRAFPFLLQAACRHPPVESLFLHGRPQGRGGGGIDPTKCVHP